MTLPHCSTTGTTNGAGKIFRNRNICSSEISKVYGCGGGGLGPELEFAGFHFSTLNHLNSVDDDETSNSQKLSIHVETSKKFFKQGANH